MAGSLAGLRRDSFPTMFKMRADAIRPARKRKPNKFKGSPK
jgi:hypothetical protein